jgi:NosR/NirI family nitrous oxide reductase transcriptional regulator
MDNTPALRVFQNQKPVGYVIINTDFNETIGYSGKPIHIAIGINLYYICSMLFYFN